MLRVLIFFMMVGVVHAQESFFTDGDDIDASPAETLTEIDMPQPWSYTTELASGLILHLASDTEDLYYVRYSLILHGDTLSTGSEGRVSLGLGTDFIYDEEDIPLDWATDVNANGITDYVIRWHSGGAHCCYHMDIYEITTTGQLQTIYHGAEKDMGDYYLKDIEGDAAMEIVCRDDIFSYFDGGYAQSPSLIVVQRWDGRRYTPYLPEVDWEIDDWLHSMDIDTFISELHPLEDEIYHDDHWCSDRDEMAPAEFWHTLTSLIEGGRCDRIESFIDRAWGGYEEERDLAIAKYKERFRESRFSTYYASICRGWL